MDLNPTNRSEPPGDDREVLLAARDGNQGAGRDLVSRHGASMVKTAWRVLGRYGGNEADDVVQEAFIAALTTPALPTGDVGAWLRSIAARKALDFLRGAARRAERSLPETDDELTGELVASDHVEGRLDVLTVRKGLAELSASDRAVLTLVDLEGLSMAEAAEALGLTRVAVKLRASRARRKLAKSLRGEKERS
jgi:RNA polymerase sigma-70 factor (ECF subfamily)